MRSYSSLDTSGSPAIAFGSHSFIKGHSNQGVDELSSSIVIPLRVKAYNTPAAKMPTNVQGAGTILDPGSDQAFGGTFASHGTRELTKLSIDGEIDTPMTLLNDWRVPALYIENPADEEDESNRITYGELIAYYLSGQLNVADNNWGVQNPSWFRDPFGRVYNNPRVLDYTANYVEAVPGRTTFNMVMKI